MPVSGTSRDEKLRAVLAQIDDDELVELARAMVRIPSPSGHEGRAISELMERWLRDRGIAAGLQEVGPERLNVWGRIDGPGPGPRLLLNGHLDTKPGNDMTIDPFGAEIRDGRLYGRGACDMKAPVAAEMVALHAIEKSGVALNGTLLFGSEVGEDGPGGWKIGELVDGPCRCDLAVVGEPTNLELHIGNRGWFQILVTTRGRATHTGMSYRGVNAIEKMCAVIAAMYAMPCFQRADPIWGRSPINVQKIAGGGKTQGAVADECVADFDIRLNPDLPPEAFERDLNRLLDDLRDADPRLHVAWRFADAGPGTASYLPADHPFLAQVSRGVAAALGQPPVLSSFPGGCAAQPIMARGVPAVVYGPGNLEQAHTVDEWIALDQLRAAVRAYTAIALQILG